MKRSVILGLIAIAIVSAASYWSYLAGLAASQESTVALFMPLAQRQQDCLKDEDIKCVSELNRLLGTIVAVQAEALKASGMAGGIEKQIDEYLAWIKKREDGAQ